MRFNAEAALVLLAWALYLFDSARLLAANEAVLRPHGAGWRAAFGSLRWKIRGKEPYLPNPWTPHAQMYVLRWDWARPGGSAALAPRPELRVFAPFVLFSGICLLVVMPLGFATRLGSVVAVAAVVAMYLSNLAALAVLVHRRKRLGLGGRQTVGLVVECLACPPFAINLVRRLCALRPLKDDFVAASTRLLPAAVLAEVHAQCLLRLNEQIDYEDEGSARMASLLAARDRFAVPIEPA